MIGNLWAGVMWGLKHWQLILAAIRMPKLPTDWQNSEQVRLFVIAFLRSDMAGELTRLMSTRWSAAVRVRVAAFAESPQLWAMAWEVICSPENAVAEKQRLRDRIRARFASRSAQERVLAEQADGVEELAEVVQALNLMFGKGRNTGL